MRARFDTKDGVFINEIVFEDESYGLFKLLEKITTIDKGIEQLSSVEMLSVAWWIVQARGYEILHWRVTEKTGVYRALGFNATTELGSLIECDTTGEPVTADHMRDLRDCLVEFSQVRTVTMISRNVLPPASVVSMSLRSPVELIGRETMKKWAQGGLADGARKLSAEYIKTLMTVGTVGLERQEFGRLLLPSDFGATSYSEIVEAMKLPKQYARQLQKVRYFPLDLVQAICREPTLMMGLDARMFEELIAEVTHRLGFSNIQLTQYSKDGGRDIVAEKLVAGIPIRFFFECKRYAKNNKVKVDTVRSLLGVIAHNDKVANLGVLVTTSQFTEGALQLITSEARLAGKDFDGIAEWLNSLK